MRFLIFLFLGLISFNQGYSSIETIHKPLSNIDSVNFNKQIISKAMANTTALILYLSNARGGIRTHCFNLYALLKSLGIKPLLVILPKMEQYARTKHVKYVVCNPTYLRGNGKQLRQFLMPLCQSRNVKIIHTNHYFETRAVKPLKSAMPVKIIYTIHADPDGWLACATDCDAVICVNQNKKAIIREKYLSKNSLLASSHPIFDERSYRNFVPKQDRRTFFRETFKLDIANKFIITLAANYYSYKNQEIAIQAMNLLVNKYKLSNICLLLAGSGNKEMYYRGLIQELNLANNVHIVGYINNLKSLMYHSDIILNTSKVEPFGIVLLEGAMLQKPIIATYGTGASAVIEHEKTGLLFQPDDADDLCKQIIRYLSDKTLARKMALECHKHVSKHFTYEHSGQLLIDFYARLLQT